MPALVEGAMPHLYAIHCPAVPEHRLGWTPVPTAYQEIPLMASGKPGRNPDLVRVLQRCPSCIVRLLMGR